MKEVVTSCTALRPIRELRLRSDAFTENTAEHDSRYISDEKALILKEAIRRPDRAERYTQKTGFLNKLYFFERVSAEYCERLFSSLIARAAEPAELLGCFNAGPSGFSGHKNRRPKYIALAVPAAKDFIFLDADAVRLIDSLVGGFDAVKTTGAHDALAFFRQGRPVAILLPLKPEAVDLPAEVAAAAREHAQRLKENQADGLQGS